MDEILPGTLGDLEDGMGWPLLEVLFQFLIQQATKPHRKVSGERWPLESGFYHTRALQGECERR